MQKEALEALIADLVTPLLDGTDLTLVDVEYVREKDWYLRIYIDKPGGVEIDLSLIHISEPTRPY